MSVSSGLLSQYYLKAESPYGTIATIAAANAFRANGLQLTASLNKEPSKQRRGSRGYVQSLDRRPTANWSIPSSPLEPSGTNGTLCYFAPVLKAGFGTEHVTALGTTIASGASTTGATLTSVTGLAVDDGVFVGMQSVNIYEFTRIKSIAGNVVTWNQLSAIPATPGSVLSPTTYKIGSSITESLSFFKYHTDTSAYKQAMSGCVVDQMGFAFDGTTEAMFSASGPGKQLIVSGSVAAKPAAHTLVGSQLGGLVGVFNYGSAIFAITKAAITFNNKLALRSNELGTTYPSGLLPAGDFLDIKVTVTFWMENTAIIDASQTGVKSNVRLTLGYLTGQMIGVDLQSVEFAIPEIPDTLGGIEVTATGQAYDVAGNDAMIISI